MACCAAAISAATSNPSGTSHTARSLSPCDPATLSARQHKYEQLTLRTIVVGQCPVSVQRDANLAALAWLELLAIQFHRVRMCEKQVVSDTKLGGRSDGREPHGQERGREDEKESSNVHPWLAG